MCGEMRVTAQVLMAGLLVQSGLSRHVPPPRPPGVQRQQSLHHGFHVGVLRRPRVLPLVLFLRERGQMSSSSLVEFLGTFMVIYFGPSTNLLSSMLYIQLNNPHFQGLLRSALPADKSPPYLCCGEALGARHGSSQADLSVIYSLPCRHPMTIPTSAMSATVSPWIPTATRGATKGKP